MIEVMAILPDIHQNEIHEFKLGNAIQMSIDTISILPRKRVFPATLLLFGGVL